MGWWVVSGSGKGVQNFRAEKRSAQASAHPLSQAQGGLFCVLTTGLNNVLRMSVTSLVY